jgi:hypothetical protein
MATAARKARKRAGIKFEKAPKTPTPPHLRSFVTQPVMGAEGTRYAGKRMARSPKKVQAFLEKYTPAKTIADMPVNTK